MGGDDLLAVLLGLTPVVWLLIEAPKLFHRSQNRCIFVFEQDYQELCGHRLARVATNCVNIVGAFVKRLSGRKGYRLFAVHAHDDAAF